MSSYARLKGGTNHGATIAVQSGHIQKVIVRKRLSHAESALFNPGRYNPSEPTRNTYWAPPEEVYERHGDTDDFYICGEMHYKPSDCDKAWRRPGT